MDGLGVGRPAYAETPFNSWYGSNFVDATRILGRRSGRHISGVSIDEDESEDTNGGT